MKKLILFSVLMFSTLGFSQYSDIKKEYDKKVLGCWKGSETDQQYEGITKYWVSCRLEDGKSILLFVSIDKFGNVQQHTENGTWWTNDGKFYEFHRKANITDIYTYKIVNDNQIEFRSWEMSGKKDNTYFFIDEKIEEL